MGRRVRHLRKAAGLTLDDLSAAVGTAPSQLSLIENGKREPKLGLLQQLAAALGVEHRRAARRGAAQPPRGPGNRAGTLPAQPHLRVPEPAQDPHQLAASDGCAGVHGGAAARAGTPAQRAGRDAGRGPPRERRTARHDARAEQLLPGVRGRGAEGAGLRGAHQRPAVPPRHRGHRRAPRVQPPPRGRPAALHPLGDRPEEPPDLPHAERTQRPRPPFGAAAGAGPLRPGPPDAHATTATS